MSHVTKIKTKFKSLPALLAAAKAIGLEKREKNTFQWYGRHVGDYPLPEGFGADDMGKCDVCALAVKGHPTAYEIGVCKARDGTGGYELLFDFWAGGYGLEKAIGPEGRLLQEEYAACHAEEQLRRAGYIVTRKNSQVQTAGL